MASKYLRRMKSTMNILILIQWHVFVGDIDVEGTEDSVGFMLGNNVGKAVGDMDNVGA